MAVGCRPADAPPRTGPPIVSGATDDTRTLLIDLAASGSLCERVRDRFVPLPNSTGAGDGRWWIQSCRADILRGQIALHLDGRGWVWVDEAEWGFRVDGYVGFEASVDVLARLEFGYDAASGIASIWMIPTITPLVAVKARGRVHPKPELLLTELLEPLLSDYAEEKGADGVREKGQERFLAAIKRGVTVTVDVRRGGGVDVEKGLLPRGQLPPRPFGPVPRAETNERNIQRRRGVHVLGPYVAGDFVLDLSVESGRGLRLLAVCKDQAVAHLTGGGPTEGSFWSEAFTLGRRAASLTAPCPWYLLTTDARDPTRFAILVAPRSG